MRKTLLLLLVVPLLLPQGVCVCDFMRPACHACANVGESSEQVSRCACCRKHKRAKAVACAGSSLARSHSCTRSRPGAEDPHLPSCPVKTGGVHWKQATVLPVLAGLAFVGLLPPDAMAQPAFLGMSAARADFDPSDQPLYLTLVNLRI